MHSKGIWDTPKSASLAFHFYHGVTVFKNKLFHPFNPREKDALWAAAALIGASAFANIQTTSIEESWPLTPRSAHDLDWLKLTSGKMAIYQLSNPKRPTSVFKNTPTAVDLFVLPTQDIEQYVANLPPKFVELYGLDKSSTIESNPYHAAASILAQVLPLETTPENIAKLVSFVGLPNPTYHRLLEDRDPRALLLLAYWYAKTVECRQQWWLSRRACLQGPAICSFLETAFARNPELIELLAAPKAAFATLTETR